MKKKQTPPTVSRIDRSSNKFTANGHTYFIQRELSLARYTEYLKLQHELAFGVDLRGSYDALTKIFNAVDKGNDVLHAIATVREISYNQINSIVDFIQRDHPSILRFCALFCNREDENIRVFDDRLVEQKIADWTAEGIEIDDFFYLAGTYNPEFRERLRQSVNRTDADSKNSKFRNNAPADSRSATDDNKRDDGSPAVRSK